MRSRLPPGGAEWRGFLPLRPLPSGFRNDDDDDGLNRRSSFNRVGARLTFQIVFVEVKKITRHNAIDSPRCLQTCIAEVAEVTDDEHQLRASTQQIKTLKNIRSGTSIAIFYL